MLAAYYKMFLISLQDRLNYRADFIIRVCTEFLYTYAIVTIWYIITRSNQGQLDPLMVSKTVKYMILSMAIGSMLHAIFETEITNKVRTGEIGRELAYPVSFPVSLFFRNIGRCTASFFSSVIPNFVIISIVYKVHWDLEVGNIIGLLVGGVIGFYIYFLIIIQVDMISFWWLETQYLHFIRDAVYKFLSGALVPLWFFPEWLYNIVQWLPFKDIVYSPLSFYLGQITVKQYIVKLGFAITWAIILTLLTYAIWKIGTKKIVVQGG